MVVIATILWISVAHAVVKHSDSTKSRYLLYTNKLTQMTFFTEWNSILTQ
jgi:hypothetical protein